MERANSIGKEFNFLIPLPVRTGIKSMGLEAGVVPLLASTFMLAYSLLVFGFNSTVALFCLVYPGIQSLRAYLSTDSDEHKIWLSYWFLYAFSFVWQVTLGAVLEQVLPGYWLTRQLFMLYLVLPQTKGALVMYYAILSPWFTYYQQKLRASAAFERAKSAKKD